MLAIGKAATGWKAAVAFARASLLAFATAVIPGFEIAPHHALLAQKLEAVERGEIKRLIISMPPRHGKSWLVSRAFASWYLGRNPTRYIIACSHTQDLATDFGREVRNDMADPRFRAFFPGSGVRPDSSSAARFHTPKGGVYFGVGVGGPITGRGAHLLLIDDPIKNREEADSPVVREKLKAWFRSTAYTRLMKTGAVVIVQTRWHEDDLAGFVQKEMAHEGWEVLNLPAICDTEDDALGREIGEALWPHPVTPTSEHYFDIESLERIRLAVGEREWNSLYQGRPAPAEGGTFKRAWMEKRYAETPAEKLKQCEMVIQSWDFNFKDTKKADFAVGQVWGARGANRFLLDQVRARLTFTGAIDALLAMREKWPLATAILVEDKANGIAVIDTLREHVPGIIAVEPHGSKEARAAAVTPLWRAGNIWLPEKHHAPWIEAFVEEHASFPNGTNDDQVDAQTQALKYMHETAPEQTVIEVLPNRRVSATLASFRQMS